MENKELDAIQAKINELQATYPFHRTGCFDLVMTAIASTDMRSNSGTWAGVRGFDHKEDSFEYIPDAKTLVFATGEALIGKTCIGWTLENVPCVLNVVAVANLNGVLHYCDTHGFSYKNVIPLDALT